MTGDAHGVRLKAIRAELARNSYCFGELASDSVITSLDRAEQGFGAMSWSADRYI